MQTLNILIHIAIILLSIILSVMNIFLILRYVAILQQNYYNGIQSLKWFYNFDNSYFKIFVFGSLAQLVLCLFSILFSEFNLSVNYYLISFLCFIFIQCIMLYYVFKLKKLKVKLNITSRVKRLCITYFLIFNALILFAYYFVTLFKMPTLIFVVPVITILCGLILSLANLFNYPIEKFIKLHYIFKAKNKLTNYKDLIVIGITGSYGKTSTKNFLYKLLSEKYNVLITPNSYNTDMGITKTILEKLNLSHEIFIVEMGADHNNDIKKLCKIIAPDISIITSVGNQHLKTFKTIDNIINTKYQIVQFAKPDVKFFTNVNNKICKLYFDSSTCEKYAVGYDKSCYCNLLCIEYGATTKFDVLLNTERVTFETKILGEYNIENIMLAISVANKLGVSVNAIKNAVKNIESVSHRLELKSLPNGAILIDNAFNSNPKSCEQSLNVISNFKKHKIVITCGMVELGSEQYNENFKFGKNLAKHADFVVIVNKLNKLALLEGLKSENYNIANIAYFNSFKEAYDNIYPKLNENSVLLIENDLTDNYI